MAMETISISNECFVTYSRKEELIFTWTIENFSKCNFTNEKILKSKTFSIPGDNEYEWQLRLYFFDKHGDGNICVAIFLLMVPKENVELLASYTLRFEGSNKKCLATYSNKNLFSETDFFWGNPFFIAHSDLLSQLQDDILIVRCEVKWESKIISTCEEIIHDNNHAIITFDEIMNSNQLSDITLEANDGVEIPSFKRVLAVHSPVFAAMFKHDMAETQMSKVYIEDIDSETIECMLCFIYTGKMKEEEWDLEKLLIAADKYEIELLFLYCQKGLYDKMTVENAVHTLQFASRHNAIRLKNFVITYILQNWNILIRTELLKDLLFSDPFLFYEIVQHMRI